jgi:hypothetical protein
MSAENNYINNEDIKKSFEYIKNLPKRSRELIDYYSQDPNLNSIYKTPGLSCDNIKLLQKIFDEAPRLTTELIVYRGLSIPNQNRISFDIDRLISTSTSYKIAKEFLSDDISEDDRKFLMEITLKPGVNFLAISLPETMFWGEDEILLPPGGSFKVISDEQISIDGGVDLLKMYIDYYPKPYEINCVQSELDLDEQYEFIYKELVRISTGELLQFRLEISDSLTVLKDVPNVLKDVPNVLKDVPNKVKLQIFNCIKTIDQLYKNSLIDLTVKSNSFSENMVYKAYMAGISTIGKEVIDFLNSKKLYKYNKYVLREITRLKTLVRLESPDLFKFDSSW